MPRTLFDSYVAGEAAAFFPPHYSDAGARRAAVLRARRPLAPNVAAALAAQNARLAPSPARDAHLAALRDGAAAVVTGQQVGLFLGPLFTIYKAASAIRVARALSAESGTPVVPLFWLQSEDHDLSEIAVCRTPSAHGAPLTSQLPAPGEPLSIAHRLLPDEVAACLAELGVELGHLPHAAAHLARLAQHYRPGAGWVAAFAGVLSEIFAPHGLLLLDPRDVRLAAAAAPLHRRALNEAEGLAALLLERGAALQRAGFEPPVHVRPGAPLSFFHPDGAAGPRYRLAPDGEGWRLIGREARYARTTVLARLDEVPLDFTTSALLRPIVQDALLPTAAYVGGPGEVAYFAQLAPLYAAYDIPMPLIVPRLRVRVIEAAVARQLARLQLTADEARGALDAMLAARGGHTTSADTAAITARLLGPFDAALQAMRGQVEPLGPGIGSALDKTRATVAAAVGKLTGKIEQARRHADADAVAAVQRVQQMLYPHGEPQERVYGFAYFAARYGETAFIDRVLAIAEPFDATPRDLLGGGEAADA
ncbi:MAG: bacillithiol biosynthesis cysteine-adding enzyme BshC [bacterium]